MVIEDALTVALGAWAFMAAFMAWSLYQENKMLIEMNDNYAGIIFSQIRDIKEELENDK